MARKKNLSSGTQPSDRTRIILEIIGIISSIVVAYLGYRQVIDPLRISTSATQTADASANTHTINPTAVPTIVPSASPTTAPTSTVVPSSPVSPSGDLRDHVLLASCNCKETSYTKEQLVLRLRWGAKTRELAERGADFLIYSVSVNGKQIQGIEDYRRPATFVESPFSEGDPPNAWWVYWDYPLQYPFEPGSLLRPETNLIETTLKTSLAIDTGWSIIPPDTTKTFTVELYIFFIN